MNLINRIFARLFPNRRRGPIDRRVALLRRMPQNSVCVEIGVHEGAFSQLILEIVQPQTLHLIDPWRLYSEPIYDTARYGSERVNQSAMDSRYQRVQARFASQIREGQVHIHRATSTEIVEQFEDAYFDWIYIDGNHLYEFVKEDLELYLPKIKPGGFLTGDDYGHAGWWDNGVTRAVDEFVSQKAFNLEVLVETQYLIRKP